ncbi:MAG: type II secretion system minor pseudopilin GspJ [Pseudomonadales bacterium]
MKRSIFLNQDTQRGFTLLEVLVSLAIFSIIALTSFRLLQSTANFVSQREGLQTAELTQQRALAILVSDLRHSIALPVPTTSTNQKDNLLAAMRTGDESYLLALSRGGYENPNGPSERAAVRIRYELRNQDHTDQAAANADSKALYRVVTAALSSNDTDEDVREQLLLKNVSAVNFRFLDQQSSWSTVWPVKPRQKIGTEQSSGILDTNDYVLPMALEVTFEIAEQQFRKIVSIRT